MVGVEYILRKARELGRPVAICLGLGTSTGSHDGISVFEEYLGNVSIQKGACLCAAMGNEAEARHHADGGRESGHGDGPGAGGIPLSRGGQGSSCQLSAS